MNTFVNYPRTSQVSTHRTIRSSKLTSACLLFLAGCCSVPTAALKELRLGDTTVKYTMQSCKPTARWDGLNLVLDGVQIPNQGDLKFSIGKINYSNIALREIKDTVFYYDGLLTATCQSLVRLQSQDAVERYSMHRDQILQSFVETLVRVESASSEIAAQEAAVDGRSKASALGSTPKQQ